MNVSSGSTRNGNAAGESSTTRGGAVAKTNFEALTLPHWPPAAGSAKSLVELERALVPKYAKSVPRADAWGTPIRFERDGSSVRIVSAGADRKFNRERWNEGLITGDYERDLVLRDTSLENVWDVSDPADRLARAYGGFLASQE